jgi:uncharacterized phage-associated protein
MVLEKNFEDKVDMRIDVPQKNLEKLKEVLLYISKKLESKQHAGKTVIYKMLYFIDFDYYEKYEEQLIGATYIKNTHGPTPLEFDEVIREMLQNGDLKIQNGSYYGYSQERYIPLRNPDLSNLKPEEIEIIDEVIERLGNMNAAKISKYSHGDVPWIGTKLKEPIKYEAAFYRTPEYSVRENKEEDEAEELILY